MMLYVEWRDPGCKQSGLKSFVVSIDYRDYMGSSSKIWALRCLFLYLCSYNLVGSVTITYELHRVRPKLFMSLWYIKCKPWTYLVSRLALSPNGPNRAPPNPRHLGLPSGVSKLIYEPMVRLTKTEHLSCTDANRISKQIETRFHMTHLT
jgi:hypothetical protein